MTRLTEKPYWIATYKKGRFVGYWRDHNGYIMDFPDKHEAQGYANIEMTQMEAVGLKLRAKNVYHDTMAFRKLQRAKRKMGKL